MVSKLAKGDYEDLQAAGLNPTLEDFDRLNCIALRLTDGAETTCANFPRIGWAGDVPFYEPTIQAFAWYHTYAVRVAANTETENTLWAFALAHAREPHFFDGLTTQGAIDKAASAWSASLPVTLDEVIRACRYAVHGFNDAEVADVGEGNCEGEDGEGCAPSRPIHRADTSAAAKNLERLEKKIAETCAKLHVMPAAIQCETPSRLDRLMEAAAVELGKELTKDESKLTADYDRTLREIRMRLKKEKELSNV